MKDMGIVYGSAKQAQTLVVGVDTVYVHSDIERLKDAEGNPVEDLFQYHEIQYEKDEYISLIAEKNETLEEQMSEIAQDIENISAQANAAQARKINGFSIQPSDVVENDDDYKSLYPYMYDFEDTSIHEDTKADITPKQEAESIEVWNNSVGSAVNSMEGKIRIYFKGVPLYTFEIDNIICWKVV